MLYLILYLHNNVQYNDALRDFRRSVPEFDDMKYHILNVADIAVFCIDKNGEIMNDQ